MALLEGNGPVDPKAQMAIVKNVNGIGAIRKEFGNVGVIKTIAKFAGRIAADLPWNPEPEVCGLPGARKLDLRTGATAWAKPEDRISMALAAAPADTLDPRWDAFLREALGRRSDGSSFPDVAERIEHMQMLCGAMAIGRATEDIVVLRGGEGTGKSTLQDAVENALGSYCVATNGERLVGTDTTHDAWKMPLAHARALSVAEMPDTGRGWRGSLMKAITSGNTIEASWKGKDPVRFRSAAVIFVTCNTMPAAYGQLLGLKRRFSLYAMDYELPHDGTKDALTGEELRPTVVRWIIDGARALLNRGALTPADRPPSVAAEVERWHADNDAVAMFLGDAELVVTGNPDDMCAVGWLRRAMTEWSRERDISVRGNLLTETLKAKPYSLTTREVGDANRVVVLGITRAGGGSVVDPDAELPF